MRKLKAVIAGIGYIISGSIGVALGNIEETIFYSNSTNGIYKHAPTYYLFWFFIILGFIHLLIGFLSKKIRKKFSLSSRMNCLLNIKVPMDEKEKMLK